MNRGSRDAVGFVDPAPWRAIGSSFSRRRAGEEGS
jgi:hypothetical protein